MNDLIWIGNTLYPRGLVVVVLGIVVLVSLWIAYRMHSAYRRKY